MVFVDSVEVAVVADGDEVDSVEDGRVVELVMEVVVDSDVDIDVEVAVVADGDEVTWRATGTVSAHAGLQLE